MKRYFVRFSAEKGFFRTKIDKTCIIFIKNKFNIRAVTQSIKNKYNCKRVRILDFKELKKYEEFG